MGLSQQRKSSVLRGRTRTRRERQLLPASPSSSQPRLLFSWCLNALQNLCAGGGHWRPGEPAAGTAMATGFAQAQKRRQGNKETILSLKQLVRLLQDRDIVTLGDSQHLEKLHFPSSAADCGFLAGGKG